MSNYNPPNDIHLTQVSSWELQNFEGLGDLEKCELFGKAIDAIIARANKTLSTVTIIVILDRIFHQNKVLFPLMLDHKIDFNTSTMFTKFVKNKSRPLEPELLQTLRCFLIELLRVMGRITADILTSPLHSELMTVTTATMSNGEVKTKFKKVPEDT